MIESELSIASNGVRLSGTLCLPREHGPFPAVVMIHGTGPLDREENMPGQRLDVFNTLAHRLSTAGIASLRYDKRGCRRSSGDYYRAGHTDLVQDARAMMDAARASEFCTPGQVFLLGHSEGCIIAPQVAASRPEVAGLVLLCPFLEGVEPLLLRQAATLQRELTGSGGAGGLVRKLAAGLLGVSVANQQRLINRLRSGSEETFRLRLQKVPAKALREMLALDPVSIFSRVQCPTLLVGGEKDLQCNAADIGRIAALIDGEAEWHVVPELTHVLRLEEGDPAILRSADLLKEPVTPVVLDLVESWLSRQVGRV